MKRRLRLKSAKGWFADPQVGFEVFDVLPGVGDAVAEEDDPVNAGQGPLVLGIQATRDDRQGHRYGQGQEAGQGRTSARLGGGTAHNSPSSPSRW